MEEIWKEIQDYPGYKVSNLGRVMNKHGRIMKLNNVRGYELILLTKDKKQYCKQVHRIVALTFIPNHNNLFYINHK